MVVSAGEFLLMSVALPRRSYLFAPVANGRVRVKIWFGGECREEKRLNVAAARRLWTWLVGQCGYVAW